MNPASLSETMRVELRRHFSGRMDGMRIDRTSFWSHWSQLADMFLPRRYKWFVTANAGNRGSQINQSIVDETGVLAARTLASGMMSGLTSPTRPWFRLGLHGLDNLEFGPAKIWLAECERRMARVFAESNFYQALATLYHDNGVFGSASMIIYDDPDQVVRCYNPCLGEFFFAVGAQLTVDSLYREFTLTISAAAEMFGKECLSEQSRIALENGGAALTREIIICHGIEPNTSIYASGQLIGTPVPAGSRYREVYWEQSTNDYTLLAVNPFREKPFVGARWDIVSNDAYGRSPGMDALPATRQLQVQQRRKGEAIDKLVRPPMVASMSMRNEPASVLPGALNFVADTNQGQGFKPAYQVDPRLAEMVEDIAETQARVKSVFFVDLFMMISQLDTVRTATEIDARREEKLIQLGPVIERFENEVLDPIIDRVFAIMLRRGLFPEPPPEIAGIEINVQYVSMLAEAQRAAQTASIERLLQVAGGLVAVDPEVMDNIDLDIVIEEYADDLSLNPRLLRPKAEVIKLREARAKAQQQAAALQATDALSSAAKNLSSTDVGGGINALQAMVG